MKVIGKSPRTQAEHYVGLTLVLMLAFCVRIYRLDHQSMWRDEIHTSALTMLPLRTVFDNLFTIREIGARLPGDAPSAYSLRLAAMI